jgi:Rieske 2Fe-2S family protein
MTTDLRTLLARRRPGTTLEAPFHTDPAIFAEDLRLIFGRHWIYVGVEPDVPEPGDCMAVDIGTHAIIVSRDDDMGLHAFHNVCRHRGARLLAVEKSNVGNIVCPYHQWTYGLDGALRFAPHMPADFDRGCYGLRPVHVRSLAGLLFVCLADTPPDDFDAMAATLAPYVAPHDIARCKVAHAEDIIEHGNWKLTMENNRECYHCSAAHPELTRSIFAEGFGYAGESETLDTRVACRRLLGALSEKRLGALSLWTQPNSWHHFMSDHIVTFAVFPLTPETTLLRTKWLVHQDAVEGRDYERDNLIAVWHATNRQDSALVGKAGAGVRSSGYQPGPYSPDTEGLVEKFSAWYVGRMAAELDR